MQKSVREELRSVKEGHIKAETLKLNVKQGETLASQRLKADAEMEQLQRYHARQCTELLRMQQQSIVATDEQAHTVRTATDKYVATEEKSRAKTTESELRKRDGMEKKLVTQKESVIAAAKVVLGGIYETQNIVRSSVLESIVGVID